MNGAISKVAGSTGRMTYKRSVVGQQMVERSLPKDANTPAQRVARLDFSKGSAGWRSLTASAKAAWNFAAKGRKRRDDVTGELYSLQGRQLYIGQASKLAQVSPGTSLDILPSAVPFAGDTISITVQIDANKATWVASAPNKAGVKTGLLAQRLPSLDRAPSIKDYVSVGFVAFNEGDGDTASVDLGPGIWALAAQFVSPTTGEEMPLFELGTLVLGLSVVKGGAAEADGAEKKAPAARAKKAA